MKILVEKETVLLRNETSMDLFWIGVISSKNKSNVLWLDGSVTGVEMTVNDLVIALGCKRD